MLANVCLTISGVFAFNFGSANQTLLICISFFTVDLARIFRKYIYFDTKGILSILDVSTTHLIEKSIALVLVVSIGLTIY